MLSKIKLSRAFVLIGIVSFSLIASGMKLSRENGFSLPNSKLFSPFSSSAKQVSFPQNDETVGSLEGKLKVTASGSANYTIPITVAPGTAGMSPDLSIQYDSHQTNGVMGMGFSLQGLTAITRVNQTLAQNGKIHGVDFTSQDRFSLDGQQLVATQGQYGADQTEYRTYIDSQAKVISYGQQGNGPASFKVWTKGGQIAEYGATDDSRIEAQGKAAVAEWALDKITDRAGNYLTVHYLEDQTNGVYYPQEIDYTGNDQAAVKPYNQVKFIYEDRPDFATHYRAGSKATLNKRLKEIQVYIHSDTATPQLVYDYHFSYALSPTTLRSRLVSIQKCAGDGKCLPATQFHWQDQKVGWTDDTSYIPQPLTNEQNHLTFGELIDLYGDGHPDLIYGDQEGSDDMHDSVWKYSPFTGWDKYGKLPYPFVHYTDRVLSDSFIDVNGDGLLDQLHIKDVGKNPWSVEVWLNDKYGGFDKAPYEIDGVPGNSNGDKLDTLSPFLLDINGNGLPDLVYSYQNNEKGEHCFGSWINTGNGFTKDAKYNVPMPMYVKNPQQDLYRESYFANLTGDGLPDYINTFYKPGANHREDIYVNNPDSTTGSIWQIASYHFPIPEHGEYYKDQDKSIGDRLIDLNGDGLTDYVYSVQTADGNNIEYAWLNTGNGFVRVENYYLPAPMYHVDSKDKVTRYGYFADLNHNGLSDYIVAHDDGQGNVVDDVYWNTGHGWQKAGFGLPKESLATFPDSDIGARLIDLNGDGLLDYMYSVQSSGKNYKGIYIANGPIPDLLTGVTDGLGENVQIQYKPLTDSSVYNQVHEAKYPEQDIQNTMYVVSRTSSETDVNDQQLQSTGMSHATDYRYEGAKYDLTGWGFLGFHKVYKFDDTTGICETTTYAQDPAHHLMNQVTDTQIQTSFMDGNLTLGSSHSDWLVKTLGTGQLNQTYYLPYTQTVTRKGYDLSGNLLSTTTVQTTLDDYNNPTQTIQTIQGPSGTYSTTTDNTYINDPNNWIIGELTKATVTMHAPNTPDLSRMSAFNYDNNGYLSQTITQPNDPKYRLTDNIDHRNSFGEVTQETTSGQGIDSRTTKTEYDSKGQFVTKQTDPLGQYTTIKTIDSRFGKPIETEDENGLKTTYSYDNFGHLTETTLPDGTTTQVSYNWYQPQMTASRLATAGMQRPTVLEDAVYIITSKHTDSPESIVYHDRLNRTVAESKQGLNGDWIYQTTQYDELSRPIKKSLPYYGYNKPQDQAMQYDMLGRVTKTTLPDGTFSTIKYDGLKTITTNAKNQTHTVIKNVRDKVIQTIDTEGHKTNFSYDAYGNQTSLTDSKGNTTTIQYDPLGRKIKMIDLDKGTWSYQYDVLGQLTSQTDAQNHTTSFTYDKLGRMHTRTDAAGTSIWTYGDDRTQYNVGKLIKVDGLADFKGKSATSLQLIRGEEEGVLNYTKTIDYNPLSLPKTITTNINGKSYVKQLTYDTDNRLETETEPNGFIKKNMYNGLGFLTEIEDGTSGKMLWQLNRMDAMGNATMVTHSNGLITQKWYDEQTGKLTDVRTYPSPAVALQNKMVFGKTDSDISTVTQSKRTINQTELSKHAVNDHLSAQASVSKSTVKISENETNKTNVIVRRPIVKKLVSSNKNVASVSLNQSQSNASVFSVTNNPIVQSNFRLMSKIFMPHFGQMIDIKPPVPNEDFGWKNITLETNQPMFFGGIALMNTDDDRAMFTDPLYFGGSTGRRINEAEIEKTLTQDGFTDVLVDYDPNGGAMLNSIYIQGITPHVPGIYTVSVKMMNYGNTQWSQPLNLTINVGNVNLNIETTARTYRVNQSIPADQSESASIKTQQKGTNIAAVTVTNHDALKTKYNIDANVNYSSDKTSATVNLSGTPSNPTFKSDAVQIDAKDSMGNEAKASAPLDIQSVPSIDPTTSDLGTEELTVGEHYTSPRILIQNLVERFVDPTQSGTIQSIRLSSDQYTETQLKDTFGIYVDNQNNLVVQNVPQNAPIVQDLPIHVFASNRIGESKNSAVFHLTTKSGWIQSLHYNHDALGNVTGRDNLATGVDETFQYDDLNRLTNWTSDASQQTKTSLQPTGISSGLLKTSHHENQIGASKTLSETTHTYQYDELGNMIYNSAVGTYTYGATAGPHAVTSIVSPDGKTTTTYQYNANGDQTTSIANGKTARTITYTGYSKPRTIHTDQADIQFYYDANRSRFERVDQIGDTKTTTLYLGGYLLEQQVKGTDISETEKNYVGPNTLIVKTPDGKVKTYECLHDGLGSVTVVTDENGQVAQRFSYTPFGEQIPDSSSIHQNKLSKTHHTALKTDNKNTNSKVETKDKNKLTDTQKPISNYGFIGQETISPVNLIHLNGRIYDPHLGRFLSADPTVQFPENSQGLNRYSYTLNNPLTFADTSGYGLWDDICDAVSDVVGDVCDAVSDVFHAIGDAFDDIGHVIGDLFSNEYFTMAVGLAVGAFTIGYGFWISAMATSAYNGAVVAINDGDINDVLKSVAVGMAEAGAWYATGNVLNSKEVGWGEDSGKWVERSAVHGVVGGGLEVAEGGDFADGFISAATSEAVGMKVFPNKANIPIGEVAARVGTAAIIGGTAQAAIGGDFCNGAKTAAFAELFNDCAHMAQAKYQEHQQAQRALSLKERAVNATENFLKKHPNLSLNVDASLGYIVGVEGGVTLDSKGLSGHFDYGLGIAASIDANVTYTGGASVSGRYYQGTGSIGDVLSAGGSIVKSHGGWSYTGSAGLGFGGHANINTGKNYDLADWGKIRNWAN